PSRRLAVRLGAEEADDQIEPANGPPLRPGDVDDRREAGEDRSRQAGIEPEPTAEERGPGPATAVVNDVQRLFPLLAHRLRDRDRGAVGGVAQPMASAVGEDDQISCLDGQALPRVRRLEDAPALLDDVELGLLGVEGQPPGGGELGPTEDLTTEPEQSQHDGHDVERSLLVAEPGAGLRIRPAPRHASSSGGRLLRRAAGASLGGSLAPGVLSARAGPGQELFAGCSAPWSRIRHTLSRSVITASPPY